MERNELMESVRREKALNDSLDPRPLFFKGVLWALLLSIPLWILILWPL